MKIRAIVGLGVALLLAAVWTSPAVAQPAATTDAGAGVEASEPEVPEARSLVELLQLVKE